MTATRQPVAIKERPILFSGGMIQALLAGRKTQSRRVMKPQPQPFEARDEPGEFWHIPFAGWPDGRIRRDHMEAMLESLCPYGKTGDRLWVKETFFCNSFDYPEATDHARENLYYRADGEPNMDGETIGKEGGGLEAQHLHAPLGIPVDAGNHEGSR